MNTLVEQGNNNYHLTFDNNFMGIEKPISTIRKAVQNLAEENASGDSLKVPESKHFKDAFEFYKAMRLNDPEGLKLSIEVRAREQDIKNKMGEKLYNVFDKVWIEVNQDSTQEINEALDQIKKDKKMSSEDIEQAIDEFELSFIKGKARIVKNDPRIVSAFLGKEEVLRNGLYGVMLSMLHVLRSNRENL